MSLFDLQNQHSIASVLLVAQCISLVHHDLYDVFVHVLMHITFNGSLNALAATLLYVEIQFLQLVLGIEIENFESGDYHIVSCIAVGCFAQLFDPIS